MAKKQKPTAQQIREQRIASLQAKAAENLQKKQVTVNKEAVVAQKEVDNTPNIKSYAKAAGLKSTLVINSDELLITSFGRGNEAIREKRIRENVISPIDPCNEALFVTGKDKNFEVDSVLLREQHDDKIGSVTSPLQSSRKPGETLLGTKDALERRYFGKTFADNIHIQLIYNILDIEKILAVHANNIVYTINNLLREDDLQDSDFMENIDLRNTFAEYSNPASKFTGDKKDKLEASSKAFQQLLKTGRLSYYGHAFYRKRSPDEKERDGYAKFQTMSEEKQNEFIWAKVPDADTLNDDEFQDRCYMAVRDLVSDYKQKDEETIYYILTFLSVLRQFSVHSQANTRASIYSSLTEIQREYPDAAAVLNEIYAEKVRELNSVTSHSSKSNFGLLFSAMKATSDAQKKDIAVDYYKFTVRKTYKNMGFSIKLLRESMIEQYGQHLKEKKYDSFRGKLYQLADFLIWNYYDKNPDCTKKLVNSLRTKVKNEQKDAVYAEEAKWIWKQTRAGIEEIADRMLTAIQSNDKKATKQFQLSKEETAMLAAAINSAKDEDGRPVKITEDVSYFTKLIYLATLFLDGKEINDLLTTLINSFEDISSFYAVLKEEGMECKFEQDYQFFANSANIGRELRAVNSFARMTAETVSGKKEMFLDAAKLLGTGYSDEELDDFLQNNVLDKTKLPKNYKGDPDTGFRNFMISNVIESDRFRYVVRYGNPRKLRAVMENPHVVHYVLADLPTTQIDRYYASCISNNSASLDTKLRALTDKLTDLKFEQFRNVKQAVNAAWNREKARDQGLISLYLNVIYQLVKNMVYINSRYTIGFHYLEHDSQLIPAGKNAGRNNKNYAELTQAFLLNGTHNLRLREGGRKQGVPTQETYKEMLTRTGCYLWENVQEAKDADALIHEYRNKVAHLNAIRNMDAYIKDFNGMKPESERIALRKKEDGQTNEYFALYHYLMQRELMRSFGYANGDTHKYASPVALKCFRDVEKYRTYNRDLVKILNIPFGYNLPRYKRLCVSGLFDRNRMDLRKKKNRLEDSGDE